MERGTAFGMTTTDIHWESLREVLHAYVETRLPRRLRRHVGVSDVVQSVFFAAQSRGHQFRGATRTEYQRWLFRIAENKIVDSMRRYRQRTCPPKLRSTEFLTAQEATCERTADSQIVLTEQSRLLLESLAVLPADIRRIIILRYTRELGFADIASKLDMAETTCRRRWFEGLQLLGEKLR